MEVGYVANTHGLQGELHVHSLTDFPEERFEKVQPCSKCPFSFNFEAGNSVWTSPVYELRKKTTGDEILVTNC